jgi:Phage protein
MDLYGLSAQMIADLTGASLKTAHRWKRAGKLPAIAARLLELRTRQDLGGIGAAWTGFQIRENELWTPERHRLTADELRAIPYRMQQLRELEREMQRPRQFVLL